jgi:polysaccharide export outer membrane protein
MAIMKNKMTMRSRAATLALLVLVAAPALAQQATPVRETASTSAARPDTAPMSDRERENYRVGPGDILEIRVLGEEQMSSDGLRVSEDGFITPPFVDADVYARCKTERELSEIIAEKLTKWLKYPRVYVKVKEYNSAPVYIMGAVVAPSGFNMQRRVTLRELVSRANGVAPNHGPTIQLIHDRAARTCDEAVKISDDELTEEISVKSLLEGDPTQNPVMRAGDIVYIPPADEVYIAGQVIKPGAFQLTDGLTLSQLLAKAGGFTPTAKEDKITIYRQSDDGKDRKEILVNFKEIRDKKAEDPVLAKNDYVEVNNSGKKSFFRGFVQALGGGVGNLPVRAIP